MQTTGEGSARSFLSPQRKKRMQIASIPVLLANPMISEYIPTVFCRTILLAFSVPGEPVVVALLCLMGAWPGWSRLHPLENDLSTETFWNSCPTPRNAVLVCRMVVAWLPSLNYQEYIVADSKVASQYIRKSL